MFRFSIRESMLVTLVTLVCGLMPRTMVATEPELPTPVYRTAGETISKEDRKQVEAIVSKLEKLPILSLHVSKKGVVTVCTGEIRGKLAGGGLLYKLEKRRGKWLVIESSSWHS